MKGGDLGVYFNDGDTNRIGGIGFWAMPLTVHLGFVLQKFRLWDWWVLARGQRGAFSFVDFLEDQRVQQTPSVNEIE